MNTPTPAHVALVAALQVAMRRVELVDKTAFPSFSDIASAEVQIDKAISDLLAALAQPALAAPVPQVSELDRWDQIRKALKEGTSLTGILLNNATNSVFYALEAQQPTPAASLADLDAISEMNGVKASVRNRREKREREVAEAQSLQPVEASPRLTLPIQLGKRYMQRNGVIAETSGERPGMTSIIGQDYSVRTSSGREWADIDSAHDLIADAATVEVAAPVALTSAAEIMLEHGMKDVPAGCKQVWFTRKEVEQITKAALSAAKPELSDTQIARGWVTEDVAPTDDPESLFFAGARYAMKTLKLQAGGEAS